MLLEIDEDSPLFNGLSVILSVSEQGWPLANFAIVIKQVFL